MSTEAAAPAETVPAPAPAEGAPAEGAAEKRPPLTEEERKAKKAERSERRKEQRKAAREAIKEAKARGEPVPPRKKAAKADKAGPVEAPEGAAAKISVANLPEKYSTSELAELFAKYGTVLRAEVSKGRGTVVYNTHADVKRAVAALNGKHKAAGQSDAITIQYTKDAAKLGEIVKKATDEVADTLKQFDFKPSILRNKGVRDFLNRVLLGRKKTPSKEVLTAALLASQGTATPEDLVKSKMIDSAAPVQQLLRDDAKAKAEAPTPKAEAAGRTRNEKPAIKIEKTFDAVIPHLDKLEKERWNRMAKANLRLSERYRFRFIDILATPSLELWRWMVEDCDITPAEAGTCFAILQTHYGFSK